MGINQCPSNQSITVHSSIVLIGYSPYRVFRKLNGSWVPKKLQIKFLKNRTPTKCIFGRVCGTFSQAPLWETILSSHTFWNCHLMLAFFWSYYVCIGNYYYIFLITNNFHNITTVGNCSRKELLPKEVPISGRLGDGGSNSLPLSDQI